MIYSIELVDFCCNLDNVIHINHDITKYKLNKNPCQCELAGTDS